MAGSRLDVALVERGLAKSRTQAAGFVAAGLVTVDGFSAIKPSTKVRDDQLITVAQADHYVSRGAHKLLAALDGFDVDPSATCALDLGASTGGFTQVLLERGARRVVALDVGHGQLDHRIREDPRVTVVEGVNVRYLGADQLIEFSCGESPTIVVADLSFISLTLVLPAVIEAVGRAAEYIMLIKPQFEVGRLGLREGIVRSAALREDAVMAVLWAAWDVGLGTAGVLPSPIAGTNGNREYLVWLSAYRGSNPTEWSLAVSAIT